MAAQVAKGIHDNPHFKLGSILGSGAADKRTLNFMDFLDTSIQAPKKWDFDKGRKPFQAHMWGNDQYGDCEIAGRANYITRLQRGETRKDSPLVDTDVIDLYKEMTGCVSPGDNNDSGLTTLDNLKQWRHGWLPESQKDNPDHSYQIAAFGFVEPKKSDLIRLSMYLFSGVLVGAALPQTLQRQLQNHEPWDYVPNDPGNEPGSWGGHCIYLKRYDEDNVYALTWAQEVQITNAFVDAYFEESYAVIESFDTWQPHKHVFDVDKLIKEMQQAGIAVQQ